MCTCGLFRPFSSLRRDDSSDESTEADSAFTRENSMKGPTIGKYKLLETIGTGSYAEVKLAIHEPSGKKVAVKIIDKTKLKPDSMTKLYREVMIMKRLDHPNIVKLFQVIETNTTFNMVMDYVSGGEVFQYIVRHGRMEEPEARVIFRQIVSAVEYCHKNRIIHRDLKDTNILFDSDMNIKIVDFGLSTEFTPGAKLDTFCGSQQFAAPEILLGMKYEGPEVDVWSLGVILFLLVTGNLPFDAPTLQEMRVRVLRGRCRIPFHVSTDCGNLLKMLLVKDRTRRASLEIIRNDKWLNEECGKPILFPLPEGVPRPIYL